MDLKSIVEYASENPIVSSAVGAFVAFTMPVWKSIRAAIVRRVDRAWNEEERDCSHPTSVKPSRVVDRVTRASILGRIMPRSILENEARRRARNTDD